MPCSRLVLEVYIEAETVTFSVPLNPQCILHWSQVGTEIEVTWANSSFWWRHTEEDLAHVWVELVKPQTPFFAHLLYFHNQIRGFFNCNDARQPSVNIETGFNKGCCGWILRPMLFCQMLETKISAPWRGGGAKEVNCHLILIVVHCQGLHVPTIEISGNCDALVSQGTDGTSFQCQKWWRLLPS